MGRSKTSIYIDDQLRDDVQVACIKRKPKTTLSKAIEDGLRLWLAKPQAIDPKANRFAAVVADNVKSRHKDEPQEPKRKPA